MRNPVTPFAVSFLTMLSIALPAVADVGKPVAIRWWGQGFVTIETFWNLTIAIDPFSLQIGYDDPRVSAELVIITHEHADHNNVSIIGGTPTVVRGLDADGRVAKVNVVLDRAADVSKPTVADASKEASASPSENAIRISSIASFHDAEGGAKRGHNAMFLIEADGVRILHMGDFGQPELTAAQLDAVGKVDVLLIPVGGVFTIDSRQAIAIVGQIKPRTIVPIHFKTDALSINLQSVDAFIESLPPEYQRTQAIGNTLAATAAGEGDAKPAVVTLKHTPWVMPDEMADLIAKKEAACAAAMPVFADLTANQMNFKPSNGTHTPRWNIEHMAGTELRFFSSIYANVDPNIPVINHMPQQMPPDYVAAHPEWSGAEEARNALRVQAFTRRFAYLLDGMALDSRPKGSPWPLQRLLAQMEFHWNEHTGNVRKKFDLPDWPAK